MANPNPSSNSTASSTTGLFSGTPKISFGSNSSSFTAPIAATPSIFAAKPGETGNLFGSSTSGTKEPPTFGGNLAQLSSPTTSNPTSLGTGRSSLFAAGSSSTLAPQTGGFFNSSDKSAFGTLPNTLLTTQATPEKPLSPLPSTTPAGAPPLGTTKPPSSGLFANMSQNQSILGMAPPTSSTGLQTPSAPTFGNKMSSVPPGTGLFGATSSLNTTSVMPSAPAAGASSGLFGSKSTIPAPSAVSSATSVMPSPLFSPSSAAPAAATAPSMFTNASVAPQITTAPTNQPSPLASSTLFGKPISAPTSILGAKAAVPSPLSIAATTPPVASQPAASTSGLTSENPALPKTGSTAGGAGTTSAAFGTASTGGFGIKPSGVAKPAAANPPTSTSNAALGASTAGPASHIPRLKNKSMDDIITRWASDLSKYQKEFKDQATDVAHWDAILVDNGDKIQRLYLDTHEAERASHEIERQLLSVEQQQDELESWLERYEAEVQDMFTRQMGQVDQLTGPDQERERTYKLSERLTQHLEEKTRNLSLMAQEMNELSGTLTKGNNAEDPLSQIVRTLNSHLTQLQWIDANSQALHAKVTAAQKANGKLGTQSYGRSDNDASESFYRSYFGRR